MELEAVVTRARTIAAGVAAEDAEVVDGEARWPERSMRALQQAGLGGLVVPTEHGGLGHGVLGIVRVCEELGRSCTSTSICFGMHLVGSAVLSAKATPDHAGRYLAPIARGEHLTTLSLSEPGTGAEFYFPQSRLSRHPDGYRVNGTKSFVTNGGYADSYVVSTLAAEPAAAGQFSAVMIPADAPGISWGPPWAGLGMRGNSSRTLELRDVPVEHRELLGSEGDQIWYVFHVVAPFFLAAMAGTYLGLASRAVDEVRAHLLARSHQHTGGALAQVPVLQQRLAGLWSAVERVRRFTYWAASEFDGGGPQALPAVLSMKAEVAECAVHVTNEALTMAGGIAYRENSVLARLLRDARAAHVMAPTTDYLRTWTGRTLLDLPVLD